MVKVFADEVSRLVQRLCLQDDHVVAVLEQVARPTDVDGGFLKLGVKKVLSFGDSKKQH